MFITTRFIGTKKDGMNYLLFLLTEDYIESHRRMTEDLEPLLRKFARDIGETGALVRPFRGDEEATKRDILSKDWNEKEKRRIEHTPGILVIDVDFDEFNPRSKRWLHFSLRDSMSRYGEVSIFELEELLSILAEACRSGENIFNRADEIARRKVMAELYDSFELKPGMFGFGFDIKKGIEFFRFLLRGVH